MGRESEGERDNFSTWGFFWFGSFRETNDGKWMTGRQLVLSCFPAFFSLLSCMCGLLAPWTFNTLQFQWHIVHEWTQCLSMQGSMGEYVVSFWFESCYCVSWDASSKIISSLASFLHPHPMSVLHLLSILRLHFLLPRCLHHMLCDERPIKWKKRILTWK